MIGDPFGGVGPAILFCPADRPDRFIKAAERADAVVLDLEDAIENDHLSAALANIAASPLDRSRTMVRVRTGIDDRTAESIRAELHSSGYRLVVVPKCAAAADVEPWSEFRVLAQIESAAGVLAATTIAAHPAVSALSWGAEDLAVSLGATTAMAEAGEYIDPIRVARATILLAASAAGKAAIDAPYSSFADETGQRRLATGAARSGFSATLCVHPAQVEVIRDAYRPTDAEIEAARGVIAAAERSSGAVRLGNSMIDRPVVLRALLTLDRAMPRAS